MKPLHRRQVSGLNKREAVIQELFATHSLRPLVNLKKLFDWYCRPIRKRRILSKKTKVKCKK